MVLNVVLVVADNNRKWWTNNEKESSTINVIRYFKTEIFLYYNSEVKQQTISKLIRF